MRGIASEIDKNIMMDRIWAEREHIAYIAEHQHVEIHVHFIIRNGTEYQHEVFGNGGQPVVHLALRNNHYTVMRAVPPETLAAAGMEAGTELKIPVDTSSGIC